MPEVICDTSPLQYLHQIDLLHLLPQLYGRIIVPAAVSRELESGRAMGIDLPDLSALTWTAIRQSDRESVPPESEDLGEGEREALALACGIPDSLLILDDMLARHVARRIGQRFTGTLGVLLKAKQEGHLGAVLPAVDALGRARFFLDASTRAAILRLAGEDSAAG